MFTYFYIFKKIFRLILFLALTGEIASCTIEMKKNAHKSVTHGLVNLKALNDHLMKRE